MNYEPLVLRDPDVVCNQFDKLLNKPKKQLHNLQRTCWKEKKDNLMVNCHISSDIFLVIYPGKIIMTRILRMVSTNTHQILITTLIFQN